MTATNHRVSELRLKPHEMKARDWRSLSAALEATLPPLVFPGEPLFNESNWALRCYAWLRGCVKLDGSPSTGKERKYRSSVWQRLANGPYRAGGFTITRDGRWGIVFILDPTYAIKRRVRRRKRLAGGLDAAFEQDFGRRSNARLVG
jgi:hypothetical protein